MLIWAIEILSCAALRVVLRLLVLLFYMQTYCIGMHEIVRVSQGFLGDKAYFAMGIWGQSQKNHREEGTCM